jgi:hypothetical protein
VSSGLNERKVSEPKIGKGVGRYDEKIPNDKKIGSNGKGSNKRIGRSPGKED